MPDSRDPSSSEFDPTVPRRRPRRASGAVPPRPVPPATPVPPDETATRPRMRRSGRQTTPIGSGAPVTARGSSGQTLADTQPGDRRAAVGGFRIGELLGRGGMGAVRSAEDPLLRRHVAIKFLHAHSPDEAEWFLEEAQITAQLEHPNVVPVHQMGHDESGRPWLAMKRIDGQSLKELIEDWKAHPAPLTDRLPRILSVFGKLCDALAFAHSRGVIHRDIKPGNVMIGAYGEVLLVDWGLARSLDQPDRVADRPVQTVRDDRADGSSRTVQGEVFGTPGYMPPEQASGRVDEVDERSDIFALGGVLYSMLTLEVPYDADRATHALIAARSHDLPSPRKRAPGRGIPKELSAIVMKAMAADAADRYATVADLQADLEAWQSFRRTSAWRPGPLERVVKWVRRHPTGALSVAMLLICGLVAAVLLTQLQAADEARRAAEAREQLAEAKREAAQQRAADQQQRAEELGEIARARLSTETTAAIQECIRHVRQARLSPEGVRNVQLDEAALDRYLAAFRDVFRVHEINGTEPSWSDHYHRGKVRHLAGDFRGAIDDFTRALELDPDNVACWLSRGNSWSALGDDDKAFADYDEGIRLGGGTPALLVNRGNRLATRGRYEEALADFAAALQLDPQYFEAFHSRGTALIGLRRLPEAEQAFSDGLAIKPASVDLLYNRAIVRFQLGKFRGAEADADAALRYSPDHMLAFTHRGNCRLVLGRPAEALPDFNAALRLNPDHLLTRHLRARALMALNRLDEADADYTRALELAGDDAGPDLWHDRAMCRHRMKRFGDAVADLDRCLAIAPDYAKGYVLRGITLGDLGRPSDDVLAQFDRALEINPRLWQAAANRGYVLRTLGRTDDAIRSLQQAYRSCNNRGMRNRLAQDIRQLGGQVPQRRR